MRKKQILFGAVYSSIEPLGLFHLSGLAQKLGWESHIRLVLGDDFTDFHQAVKDIKPDVVGFTIYSGGESCICAYLKLLKDEYPNIRTIVGGPHATYFPEDVSPYVDNVVVGEGYQPVKAILEGWAPKSGVVTYMGVMPFPKSYRERFYADYPVFRDNPIKNFITQTGCPFSCTYCYNSTDVFPVNHRTPDDVLEEITDVMRLAPKTTMFSVQDDTLGAGKHIDFLKEFADYNLGLDFHGQTRWEVIDPRKERGIRVLELLCQAGFTGMTMAIEAADPAVCSEILNRNTEQDNIFATTSALSSMGFSLRTEQMTGLPYGATQGRTVMNLEADLEILKLNMDLYRMTAECQNPLPNIAWATTLIPYRGTVIADYCVKYGYATDATLKDPRLGYHERSRLRHLCEYVGPELTDQQEDEGVWLDEDAQEKYRNQNAFLRDMFHVFGALGKDRGALDFVRTFLEEKELTVSSLNTALKQRYRYAHEALLARMPKDLQEPLWDDVGGFCAAASGSGAVLMERFQHHLIDVDDVSVLSNIVKKYLFDTQLYKTNVECQGEVYHV